MLCVQQDDFQHSHLGQVLQCSYFGHQPSLKKNPNHNPKKIIVLICVKVGADFLGRSGVSCILGIALLLTAFFFPWYKGICAPPALVQR